MTTPGAEEITRRFREDGAGAAVSGSLELVLGRVASALDRQRQENDRLALLVHPAPISYAQGGPGTVDQPDRFGPKDGFLWDLRRITVSGFSAGSVAVYKNDVNGPQLANFTAPGEWTWSGQQWLKQRDRLIFIATGITGNVIIDGDAIAVSQQIYPQYVL